MTLELTIDTSEVDQIFEDLKKALPTKSDYTTLARQLKALAESFTPVDTGSWRDAHMVSVGESELSLFISPTATNSRTGEKVNVYAAMWEERGGGYAVYGRVMERIPTLVDVVILGEINGIK